MSSKIRMSRKDKVALTIFTVILLAVSVGITVLDYYHPFLDEKSMAIAFVIIAIAGILVGGATDDNSRDDGEDPCLDG